MNTHFGRWCWLFLLSPAICFAAPAKPATDPLNRLSPQSTVTAFLQTCEHGNYTRAALFLDLTKLPARERENQGPVLAKDLESILNSDGRFDVLRLSQNPDGNVTDNPNPSVEVIATETRDGKPVELELERSQPTGAATPIWLFSTSTVAAIPSLRPADTSSAVEAHLPRFLVATRFLDTPLWKWLALLLVVFLIAAVFRLAGHVTLLLVRPLQARLGHASYFHWIGPVLQPWLVFLSAMVLVIAEQFIDPSALSRLYIGRGILLVVIWAFAWCFINVVDLFLTRIDRLLDPRQKVVSHSLLYMGRRAAKVTIVVVAIVIILDNWGYNMTTMIAGLGVGGIAVALAAQGTIANVFGGVSVIADHPVMVGDFGKFGDVIGTIEDIGLRSTRVRTLNRTMMSIPNASLATMNLENFALRDKILFNPTLPIKRGTPRAKLEQLIVQVETLLKSQPELEIGQSPVRLTGLTATTLTLEIFAYSVTRNIDEFYKIEAALFLDLDALLGALQIELG